MSREPTEADTSGEWLTAKAPKPKAKQLTSQRSMEPKSKRHAKDTALLDGREAGAPLAKAAPQAYSPPRTGRAGMQQMRPPLDSPPSPYARQPGTTYASRVSGHGAGAGAAARAAGVRRPKVVDMISGQTPAAARKPGRLQERAVAMDPLVTEAIQRQPQQGERGGFVTPMQHSEEKNSKRPSPLPVRSSGQKKELTPEGLNPFVLSKSSTRRELMQQSTTTKPKYADNEDDDTSENQAMGQPVSKTNHGKRGKGKSKQGRQVRSEAIGTPSAEEIAKLERQEAAVAAETRSEAYVEAEGWDPAERKFLFKRRLTQREMAAARFVLGGGV